MSAIILTQEQFDAIVELVNAADNAVSEEREYWDDQNQTPDHREPDWLGRLGDATSGAVRNLRLVWDVKKFIGGPVRLRS